MKDQAFTYKGYELETPLRDLLEQLTKAIATANEDSLALNDHQKKMSFMTGAALSPAAKKLNDLKWSLARAANWLRECQRTPSAEWVLDFSDLDWLYRQRTNI